MNAPTTFAMAASDLEQWAQRVLGTPDDEDWYDGRTISKQLPPFEADSLLHALGAMQVRERAAFDGRGTRAPVRSVAVALGPEVTASCPGFGTYHVVERAGHVALVWAERDPEGVRLCVTCGDDRTGSVVLDEIVALIRGRCSAWRKQAILFDLHQRTWYRHLPAVDDAQIHLDPDLAGELRRNLVTPILRYEEARRLVPGRGVILFGPPGTGKTWAVQWVRSQVAGAATVIMTTPAMFASATALNCLFELVAADPPTLLCLEDIDLTLRSRELGGGDALGELLSFLDGPGRVDGVFTAATTNHLGVLDLALSERPGRFDVKLEVGSASREARRAVLTGLAATLGLDEPEAAIEHLVSSTEDWTLAEIHDLGQVALLEGLDTDTTPDLHAALRRRQPPAPLSLASNGYA